MSLDYDVVPSDGSFYFDVDITNIILDVIEQAKEEGKYETAEIYSNKIPELIMQEDVPETQLADSVIQLNEAEPQPAKPPIKAKGVWPYGVGVLVLIAGGVVLRRKKK